MAWEVEFEDECLVWFEGLEEGLQDEILAQTDLLSRFGPNLGRPKVDSIKESSHSNMKELRIQYKGDPWRILFAFDPLRTAILLVGGNKGGNEKRWYKENIPIADRRYTKHLQNLKRTKGQQTEGQEKGKGRRK